MVHQFHQNIKTDHSFVHGMLFISFSCLIAVASTPNIMLNKSGKSQHPCLVLDLRGKAFSFSLWSSILAVGLLHMTFIMLRYIPSNPAKVFILNGCWILSDAFSASFEIIIWLFFILPTWWIALTDFFQYENHPVFLD